MKQRNRLTQPVKARMPWNAVVVILVITLSCGKKGGPDTEPVRNESFVFISAKINGTTAASDFKDVPVHAVIKLAFTAPVSRNAVGDNIVLKNNGGANMPTSIEYEKGDSVVSITSQSQFSYLSKYTLSVLPGMRSAKNTGLGKTYEFHLLTSLDSSDKFPLISDDALLDSVQYRNFRYFWDFGHPVSGLSRERNSSGDLVTSGGSGMGIMAILAGINRHFITRAEGLSRLTNIVDFLSNTAQKYKGAFPHWLNGATGATIPFSENDDGADLVETAYLVQGLLCARQYFDGADAIETTLRNQINTLWNNVEWDWFRQNGQNVLYWHWSNDKNWVMNFPVRGWNEALITYVLAASSTTHSIDPLVYTEGWAQNGSIKNGGEFFGYTLPLGPPGGGPLFFEHYSFLGINPNGLDDQFADYHEQVTNHTLINHNYCKLNPNDFFGYSDACWGLTASDDPAGYAVHEPGNENGVITPSAALSSFPYTPAESMKALKFFYYKLGNKIWKEYGFVDAFRLDDPWFADSFLAIDQGPIVVMIENYRSGLLWNLFTSCPEVKAGLTKLGFTAPYL